MRRFTCSWTSGRRCGRLIAFESLAALAREGKTNRAGAPCNPLLAALILRHFEDEIYFVRPPLALQRVVLGPLAALARVLGYRAEHPYVYPGRTARETPEAIDE